MRTLSFTSYFLLLAFCSLQGFAQNQLPRYEIGFNAGASLYQGDLAEERLGSVQTMKPVFSLYGIRNINQDLAVRINLMHGRIKGNDGLYDNPAWRKERNLNFASPITELSAFLIWHPVGLSQNEAGIINLSPYLMGGAGYTFLNINRDWSGFNSSHFSTQPSIIAGLAADQNQHVPGGIITLPIGAGVRMGITPEISVTFEGIYHKTFTDYLDGFSQAGNPDKKDNYSTLTAGLIFSLGRNNSLDCPKVTR